jgi:hypothetical protein
VCATYSDGWRLMGTLMIGGHQAVAKAQRVGQAILQRCERLMSERGWGPFTETSLEVLGAESTYGPHARQLDSREVVLKLAAKHPQREALELLAREIAPSATSMAQGITGFAAGRPAPSPVIRLFSFVVEQEKIQQHISMEGIEIPFKPIQGLQDTKPNIHPGQNLPVIAPARTETIRVPLLHIAHGRSGDKGDTSNIGVIARSTEAFEWLQQELTPEMVKAYLAHIAEGDVRRYSLPGFNALNFVLEKALGGGGVASLRYDPQGKAFAQMLLGMELDVPQSVLESLP